MFIVIYKFDIKPEKREEFISAWTGLTKMIYEFEGSLGSRLHQQSDTIFIGYAQWPSKETWSSSGDNMPTSVDHIRQSMRSCCTTIETIYELEMVEDLLKDTIH